MNALQTLKKNLPAKADFITIAQDLSLITPDCPAVGYIEGDGTGADIWRASQPILDAAVAKAYGGKRSIAWVELLAGEKAFAQTGQYLSEEVFEQISALKVAIKGPLTTPVGGGFRSLNVTLRQRLDLYACIRPVRWLQGVPSPVREPHKVDMVVFRENTEDVYAGLEWPAGSAEAQRFIDLTRELGGFIEPRSAIGLKPMSAKNSKRLIKRALDYALAHKRQSVTLVHKGNIQKFTEGAFRDWGYELAAQEYKGLVVKEDEPCQPGQVVIKDRIADNMFQQILLRPDEFQVLASPNLNGDYISDALAAQVGGLGMAPGANIGDQAAIFEATHGSAPKYAGQDKVNPGSVVLSGAMLLEHLGWREAADLIAPALSKAILKGEVTYDLARQIPGANEVKASEFSRKVIESL